jgi:hypothetical protein
MNRSRIEANQRIFSFFDNYCRSLDAGQAVDNEGAPRWIKTEDTRNDRGFLTEACYLKEVVFSPRRIISVFLLDDVTYFFVIGFEWAHSNDFVYEDLVTGGMLTTLLNETSIKPAVSASTIRNIVGGLDADQDYDYDGHYKDDIMSLLPSISVFSARDIEERAHDRIIFSFCVHEVKNGDLHQSTSLQRLVCSLLYRSR